MLFHELCGNLNVLLIALELVVNKPPHGEGHFYHQWVSLETHTLGFSPTYSHCQCVTVQKLWDLLDALCFFMFTARRVQSVRFVIILSFDSFNWRYVEIQMWLR